MHKIITPISFILSFFITYKLIPSINKYGITHNIVDTPNKRKQHKKPLVRLGGVAMFLAFLTTLIFIYTLGYFFELNLINNDLNYFIILTTSFFLIGLADDFLNLSPLLRLISQFLISSFVWFQGFRIDYIYIPLLNNEFLNFEVPLLLSLIITTIWIVGITNSINWIDGLDGLASGVVLISLFAFFLISLYTNNKVSLLLIPILFGTILGFLKYNSYPSNILMGDGGSHFLGSTLAFLSLLPLISNYYPLESNLSFNILFSIFILGIPLFDMVYVVFSRLIEKHSPFYPDRRHIHHRLLNMGLNHKKTVLAIYFLQLLFCMISIIIFYKISV